MAETPWSLHKPPMISVWKIGEQTGEKIKGWIEEKIDGQIGSSAGGKTGERIGRWTGVKIDERIADRTPAVNSVDLIGPTMLPVNMAERGERMLA